MKKLIGLGLFLQVGMAHAGSLSFMPAHPNRPNNATVGSAHRKIISARVGPEFRGDQTEKALVLYLYDENDRGCIIHQDVVPQVDLSQLAVQAMATEISILCTLGEDEMPVVHAAKEASSVELSLRTKR